MKTNKHISKFMCSFNRAISSNRQNFLIKPFHGLNSILDNLYKDGFIVGYKNNDKENIIEIFLKIDHNGRHLATKATNISKPSRIISGRLKELKAAVLVKPHSLLFIRTSKCGIIAGRQAIFNKIGGIIVGKIQ
jgi:ribosomal protein S8